MTGFTQVIEFQVQRRPSVRSPENSWPLVKIYRTARAWKRTMAHRQFCFKTTKRKVFVFFNRKNTSMSSTTSSFRRKKKIKQIKNFVVHSIFKTNITLCILIRGFNDCSRFLSLVDEMYSVKIPWFHVFRKTSRANTWYIWKSSFFYG